MKKISIIMFAVAISSFSVYGQDSTNQKKKVKPTVNKDLNQNFDSSNKEIRIDYPFNNKANLENSQSVWSAVETFPQFKGGQEKLAKFIYSNLIYPKEMKDNNLQGRVTVQFIVESDGSLSYIRLGKPFGNGADEEALRVIKLSPKWFPGLQGGKPVRVLMTIPIDFKLSK
jgi:protein TonB